MCGILRSERQRGSSTPASPAFDDWSRLPCRPAAATSELGALQVHDFNPDSGTISIRQSKTDRPRHVVLTDEGVALFKQLCVGRAGSEPMLQKTGGGLWGRWHQKSLMREACDHAKITPRLGFHGLRHTWASHAVMNGVPLLVVAKNLGHSDTRMVERHYGHLGRDYVSDAIRAGAPKFGFKPDPKLTTLAGKALP